MKRIKYILLLFLCLGFTLFAQPDKAIDSLKQILKKNPADTTIAWVKNLIAEQYFTFKPDTAFYLWKVDEDETLERIVGSNGTEIRSFKRTLAELKNSIGAYYFTIGKLDSVIRYWNESIEIRRWLNDDYGVCLSYINMGFLYYNQSDLKNAIKYWQDGLLLAEKINNVMLQTSALSNLGGVYYDIGEIKKGIDTYLKLISICEKNNQTEPLDSHYYNLASMYNQNKDITECKKYLQISYKLAVKNNSVVIIAQCENLFGDLFAQKNQNDSALAYFEKSYLLAKKNNLAQLIPVFCSGIADLYYKLKQYDKALVYATEQYESATQFKSYNEIQKAAETLSSIYDKKGDLPQAYKYFKLSVHLRDSLNKIKNEKEILKNQLEFDHEREKIALQKEQEKKEAVTKIIIYFISSCLLLVLLLIGIVFRNLNLHKRKNKIISRQKELVEEKQKEILDSIRYAKRIQTALLPSDKYIERKLNKD
jgi:tetratricopeptide (TPR) repeat protein